jgi:CRISPR system Cascade subunit CasD
MATLLIPLVGPLQAWGLDARFDLRQTAPEPSFSAVLGLLCCCLGRDRSEPIDDLAALQMGVRVDREGSLLRDFHTAQNVVGSGSTDTRTVVSNRWYLSDAAFLVGLEGDAALLQQIHQALIHPHWTPSLGRRSCIPSIPLFAGGVVDIPLLDALQQAQPLVAGNAPRRCVITDPAGSQVRPDQPLGPFSRRRYGNRHVRTVTLASS